MRILQLEIENFRGISKGTVVFSRHGLLVGPNNVGKSTVLEALDLVLGPDRLKGPTTIDEHDFHIGKYLPPQDRADEVLGNGDDDAKVATEGDPGNDQNGDDVGLDAEAPRITITVTLGELTEKELTRFRSHVEVWNATESRVYTHEESESLTTAAADYVLRVRFNGWYAPDEDEFQSETVFLNPQGVDGELSSFGRADKRTIGFLYLRSLRTARRAATLQRGSLLDILLHLDGSEPRIWQDVLDGVMDLGSATSKEPGLRKILDELERAMAAYVPGRRPESPPTRLNVTQLTREQLRSVMTYFMTDQDSGHLLPYDRLGSGITNLLVLTLLTLIAERKQNVIFAMEEPEIALGPSVQRRIVSNVKSVATQALLTSHSPYVAEQMLPDSILVLRRESAALTSRVATATPELKEKLLRQHFRQRYAEGLLGNAVVIVEGETEMYAMPVASDVLAAVDGTTYRSLDVLGVIPVLAGSDGELAKAASFFKNAGIDTYVFADTLNDRTMHANINAVADDVHEHPYKNFEDLLSKRMPLSAIQVKLKSLANRSDYPQHVGVPGDGDAEDRWRDAFSDVLSKRKNEGYAALVLKDCRPEELPKPLCKYLARLHRLVTGEAIAAEDPLHALVT